MTAEDDPNRRERRQELGVPDEVGSCHTAVVAGYVIEGHVPLPAIERLLADQPDVIGLALPGMPNDSPGMGGNETTWSNQQVVAIGRDNTVSLFDY